MQVLNIVYFLFLIAIFYLLLIKPQQARVKDHKKMLSELAVEDEVITMGGIHAKVKEIAEETVDLQIAENVVVKFAKNSILAKK